MKQSPHHILGLLFMGVCAALMGTYAWAGTSTGDGYRVTVSPERPNSQDRISIRISDTWSDGCIPTEPVSHRLSGHTIRITATPSTSAFCTFALTNYQLEETIGRLNPGTYTVEYYVGDARQPGSPKTFTVDPAPGTISFSSVRYTVSEDGGHAVITLVRSGGRDGFVSALLQVRDGSATAGEDYTDVSGAVRFPDGVTTATVRVPVLSDAFDEGEESVRLTLVEANDGARLGSPSSATLFIQDAKAPQPPPQSEACATFNLFSAELYIPYFDAGADTYWVTLRLVEFEPIIFEVESFGVVDPAQLPGLDGESEYAATFNFFTGTLHVPCIDLGQRYWADFGAKQGDPIRLELIGSGEL